MIDLEVQAIELEEKAKQSKDYCEKCVLFGEALQIREKLGHRRAIKFCLANLRYSRASCLLEKCKEKREFTEEAVKEVRTLCLDALPLFLELGIFELGISTLALYTKAHDLKCKEKGRYEYTSDYISVLESGINKIQELTSEEELRSMKNYLWLMYNFHSKKSIFLAKQGTIDALRESFSCLEKAIEYAKIVAPHRVKTLEAYLIRRKIKVFKAENAGLKELANLYLNAARLSKELGNKRVELEDYAES